MTINSKKIMVVEDDEDIRETIAELLDLEGYGVQTASNGQEALSLLEADLENLPSLIIVDLMMPVMDGINFKKHQEDTPSISHIPVVVMSADGKIENRQREMRAQGYLRKPVDVEAILQVAARYCKIV